MNRGQIKRQENGNLGEERTESILLEEFWVLRRSVDIAGADFLIQIPVFDIGELNRKAEKASSFGIIQAKYMQKNTTVQISRNYIDTGSGPRENFFVFVQRDSRECNYDFHYFNSSDVVNTWYISECGEYYRFGEAQARDVPQFNFQDRWDVLERIRENMQISATQQNIELIERMFGIYVRPTQHHSETPDFHYYLKYVEGVPLVICKDLNTGAKYLLEHRRELYQDNGSFSWGSDGTSTHALATSLLAHHFNGQRPAESHIRSIVYNLISKLAPRAEHIIKTSDILDALNTGLSEENLMQHRAEALILGAEELGVEVLTIDSLNKDDTVNVTLKTGENLSLPMKLFGINDQFLKYLLDTCKSSTDAVKPAIRALVKVERSQSGELKSLIICGPIQYDN